METTFSVLNRNYVPLDESIFAIQKNNFPEEKRVLPTQIIGQIIDTSGDELSMATVWISSFEKAFDTNLDGEFIIRGYFANHEKVKSPLGK